MNTKWLRLVRLKKSSHLTESTAITLTMFTQLTVFIHLCREAIKLLYLICWTDYPLLLVTLFKALHGILFWDLDLILMKTLHFKISNMIVCHFSYWKNSFCWHSFGKQFLTQIIHKIFYKWLFTYFYKTTGCSWSITGIYPFNSVFWKSTVCLQSYLVIKHLILFSHNMVRK